MKSKFLKATMLFAFSIFSLSVVADEQRSNALDIKKLTFKDIIQYEKSTKFKSPEYEAILKFHEYFDEKVENFTLYNDSYTTDICKTLKKYTELSSKDLLLQHIISPWVQNMTIDQFESVVKNSKEYLASSVSDMNVALEKTEKAKNHIKKFVTQAEELSDLYSDLNLAYQSVYRSDYFKTLYKKQLVDQLSLKLSYDKSTNEIVLSLINHSDSYDLIDVDIYFAYVKDGSVVHKTSNLTVPMKVLLKKEQKHIERLPCGNNCKSVLDDGGNVKPVLSVMNIYSEGLIFTLRDIDKLDDNIQKLTKYKSILEQSIPEITKNIIEKEEEILNMSSNESKNIKQ